VTNVPVKIRFRIGRSVLNGASAIRDRTPAGWHPAGPRNRAPGGPAPL